MNFDIMAIKADELDNMSNAVENYTVAVEDEIKKIRDYEINAEGGVYGAAQVQSVNNYISKTCDEIGKIVRYFDEFKEALTKVNEAYEAKQQTIKINDVEAHQEPNEEELINVNRMD